MDHDFDTSGYNLAHHLGSDATSSLGFDTPYNIADGSNDADIHCDSLNDHPDTAYPPPSFIDFASGSLRPPFPPTPPAVPIFHCKWLGGPHEGHPLATTLDEYVQLRQTRIGPCFLEFAALIQSQLTFGLLEAVLRIKIPESFLLSQAADGTTITLSTANLATLCQDLYHRMKVIRSNPDKSLSWLESIAVTLSEAKQPLQAYFLYRNNPFLAAGLQKRASEDIVRVLCMIGCSLGHVLLSSSTERGLIPTIPTLGFPHRYDTKPAEDQLRSQGWCPLTIAALKLRGIVILEYARSLRPFLRRGGEHDGCTDMACGGNNIDHTTYLQRHSSDACKCAPTIPSFHSVDSLLSSGRIPVVALSDEGLSVLVAEDVPYVAISHVWVDGLGSTTEAGLPACQVSLIASMASSLIPGGAFWIDALCVPDRKALRKQAIQLMAKTYTDAAAVLVIDTGIRSCSKYAPLEERLLRILTSGWMQRLWTFQEAMLAKKLWFEFADGLEEIANLTPSHVQMCTNPILWLLGHKLWEIRSYISGDASAKDSLTISDIMDAVRWRTTSRTEDETLAVAGLLQIDVRELLSTSSSEERMKALLLQKGRLSQNIIFDTAPKISGIPGFSWAPRSFMTGPHSRGPAPNESAICTPTGLLAEYALLRFAEPVELNESTRYVIRTTTRLACSFLLLPIKLARERRRELCNAILIDPRCSTVIGTFCACVGVWMVDEEEGTFGESEQACQYHEICFSFQVIDVSKASQLQYFGTPFIDAKWFPRMKVRVV